jgi:ATP-dependent Zn protease
MAQRQEEDKERWERVVANSQPGNLFEALGACMPTVSSDVPFKG